MRNGDVFFVIIWPSFDLILNRVIKYYIEIKIIYFITISYFIEKCFCLNFTHCKDYKDTVKNFKCWFSLF